MAKRYGCKFCGSWFTNPHAFGGHLNSHKGETSKCKCDRCGSPFESALSLNAHKAHCAVKYVEPIKTSRPDGPFIFCDICKAPFKNVQGLGSHKRVHDSRQDGSGHPPTPKPEAKKYLLTYDGEEIVEIGTEKQILDRLRVDADMGELPDLAIVLGFDHLVQLVDGDIALMIKVKLGVAQPVK